MRIRNLYAIIFVFIILTGCASNPEFSTIDSFPERSKTIVLFEPDVELSEMTVGGLLVPKAKWTETATNNLNKALDVRIGRIRGNIKRINSGSNKEPHEIQLLKTMSAMGLSVLIHNGPFALPSKEGNNEWIMGKETSFLKEKYKADYGLLFFVRDQFTSDARQATKLVAALLGIQMAAAVQQSYAAIIDLDTGEIVWFNHLLKTTGDTRTFEGASEMINELMAEMPS